jgi:hypothetical protein
MHLSIWGGCLMGATFSPYHTGQGMGHVKEMILGNRRTPIMCTTGPWCTYNFRGWKFMTLGRHGLQR